VDAQRRIAELEAERDAERLRSERLEQQLGALLERVTALTQKVAELTERLGQNSRNSHLPPSSDPPGTAGKSGGGQRPKSGRSRGGQRGHRGARRELIAADKVDDLVNLYPAECENCWTALPEQPEPAATAAKRYQWIEVPPLRPYIKETRRHEVTCPCCGHKTRAAYDAQEIPASPFGPRLMSMVALLTGVYHVSRRRAAKLLSDLVGAQSRSARSARSRRAWPTPSSPRSPRRGSGSRARRSSTPTARPGSSPAWRSRCGRSRRRRRRCSRSSPMVRARRSRRSTAPCAASW